MLQFWDNKASCLFPSCLGAYFIIYCLGLGCLTFVLQVLSIGSVFLDLYSSSIKPQDPLNVTYRGGSVRDLTSLTPHVVE
jgi:hypothetical protein